MEPDQTVNEVEAAKQAEAAAPGASTGAPISADASPDSGGSAPAIEMAPPPQIDPVVAAEAATAPEPQQPSEQE